MPQRVGWTLTFEYQIYAAFLCLWRQFPKKIRISYENLFICPEWLGLSRNHCDPVYVEIVNLGQLLWDSQEPELQSRKRAGATKQLRPSVSVTSPVSSSWLLILRVALHALYLFFKHCSWHTLPNMGHFCRSLTQSAYCPLNNRALPGKGFIQINFLTPSGSRNIFFL